MIGRAGAWSVGKPCIVLESGKPPQAESLPVDALLAPTDTNSMRLDNDQCAGEFNQVGLGVKRLDEPIHLLRPKRPWSEEHDSRVFARRKPSHICEI